MPDERITLEARLIDLGAAIAFPVTPPLATLVGDRLRETPRRGWGRPFGRSVALALAATLLLAAIAAAFGIGLGGLRLVFGPDPSPLPSIVLGPGLGEATTLGEARASTTFDLRLRACRTSVIRTSSTSPIRRPGAR